jgi:TonB family protein
MSETQDQVGLAGRIKRFAGENRAGVITGAIALIVAAVLFYLLVNTSVQPQVKEAPPPIQIQIQRPKPPPPPPPPPKIPQMKQITPQKLPTPTPKPVMPSPPKAAPPKPAGPPPLGTSIKNNTGDSGFGALANGGGDGVLGGTGDGGGGGRSFAAYVTAEITAALSRNPKTRNASAGLVVSIWLNAAGTVTQVAIVKSSGDSTVDDAVKNEVLPGMNFTAPPANTAMPITMSLTGQQPL